MFSRLSYSVNVREDAELDSTIAQVTANDADEGINAIIEYSITQGEHATQRHHHRHFSWNKPETEHTEIMFHDRNQLCYVNLLFCQIVFFVM